MQEWLNHGRRNIAKSWKVSLETLKGEAEL